MAHEEINPLALAVCAVSPPRPALCSPPGMTSRSKFLLASINALTTCIVDEGSTLVSSSPTTSSTFPCKRHAWSTFDESEYCCSIGHPIHCSFHQILSMRLS